MPAGMPIPPWEDPTAAVGALLDGIEHAPGMAPVIVCAIAPDGSGAGARVSWPPGKPEPVVRVETIGPWTSRD